MSVVRGRRHACPFCDRDNNASAGMNTDAPPKPGDASICLGCGNVGIIASHDGKVRLPTEAEADQLACSPAVHAARDRWKRLQ